MRPGTRWTALAVVTLACGARRPDARPRPEPGPLYTAEVLKVSKPVALAGTMVLAHGGDILWEGGETRALPLTAVDLDASGDMIGTLMAGDQEAERHGFIVLGGKLIDLGAGATPAAIDGDVVVGWRGDPARCTVWWRGEPTDLGVVVGGADTCWLDAVRGRRLAGTAYRGDVAVPFVLEGRDVRLLEVPEEVAHWRVRVVGVAADGAAVGIAWEPYQMDRLTPAGVLWKDERAVTLSSDGLAFLPAAVNAEGTIVGQLAEVAYDMSIAVPGPPRGAIYRAGAFLDPEHVADFGTAPAEFRTIDACVDVDDAGRILCANHFRRAVLLTPR